MKKVKNVDEYIDSAPKDVQGKLGELRRTIKAVCPEAVESMSYGLAAYKYLDRPLIYYGAWKAHIGIYPFPSNIEKFKEEIKKYVTSKGAVQIPLNEKLPLVLIKKMVKTQMKKIKP